MAETSNSRILAATGLLFEARIAEQSQAVTAIAGGGDKRRLSDLLETEIARGNVAGIVSFGLAGALAPALSPGDVVVARAVVTAERRFETDPAWTARLATRLAPARDALIFASDSPIVTATEKQQLYGQTGAIAVDMESHAAAEAAARHGLPFAVLRVIADDAARSIPPAALAGMRPDGSTDVMAVIKALSRAPGDTGALIALGLATKTARAALLRSLRLSGRGLAGLDLG